MRKFIITTVIFCLVFLAIDTVHISTLFINFLLLGEIPFTDTSLSPTMMLAIMTASAMIILLEILSYKITRIRQMRQKALEVTTKKLRAIRSSQSLDLA